MKFVQRVHII